ncbi:unnamed protein product [Arctia plantaginis]|uniref:Uncharacterized protein n=1 Tax=Arctia plantaginis TaxID=874455 RepID=A0A8S1BSR4_ARCPL|nr:unnamed protein product [Arctia plantaginis]
MSTINWTIEKKLCRCCHAEGDFKNLAEPCIESGNEEIYVNMIKDCFLINLVPVPGQLCAATYTICEACITSVRDAAKFRKQVATCEEKFKEFCRRNAIIVKAPTIDVAIKEETPDSCHEDEFSLEENDNFDDIPDYGFDEQEIKSDSDETAKKKSKKARSKPTEVNPSQKRKKGRPKKMKEEPQPEEEEEAEKRKDQPRPKFHLNDGDYTVDGTTFACTRCDKRYDKIFSLRYHVKTKHYKIPRYVCQYCMKEFMTPAPLTVHKLEEHSIDDRFKCNACKGTFNTKVQLRKHINNFHMLGERYSCEFCEYESFSFEAMYKHKFKHKTSKDHQCRFCRKAFVRKTTLALHERIHTGDRRKVCKVCGQAFVQKASLNYHMTKYHPEVNF